MKRFLILLICMITIFGFGMIKAEAKTCNVLEASKPGQYTVGDKYNCFPGDGSSRTFYILEIGEDEIYLLMDKVLENSSTTWGDARHPGSANVAIQKMSELTPGWNVERYLPTAEQIVQAGGIENFDPNSSTNSGSLTKNTSWLSNDKYWTSTTGPEGYVWVAQNCYLGLLEQTGPSVSNIRPSIRVSKSEVELSTSTGSSDNNEIIAELQQELSDLKKELADTKNKLTSLDCTTSAKIKELETQVQELLTQLTAANQSISDLQSSLNDKNAEITALNNRISSLLSDIGSLVSEINEIKKDLSQLEGTGVIDEEARNKGEELTNKIEKLENKISSILKEAGNVKADNKGSQTVSVGDTLKTAFIGYLVGSIILVLGAMILIQEYRKNKKKDENENIQ